MYYCDPPLHTVPYYDHTPFRPMGVFVAAGLTAQSSDMPLEGCFGRPQAEEWHRPDTDLYSCGQGFVLFSTVQENLKIRVTPLRGSGCNAYPYMECTPLYPLELPLKVGRNNIIWCTEACITIARNEDILDPWEDIATDMGSVLYFPRFSPPLMRNFALTGDTYMQTRGDESPIQPVMMSMERCRVLTPPRFTMYAPPGTTRALLDWCREQHPADGSAPPPSSIGHTIRLFHRELPIAIPPSRCFCGKDYEPGDEDYTTGGPPVEASFADDILI